MPDSPESPVLADARAALRRINFATNQLDGLRQYMDDAELIARVLREGEQAARDLSPVLDSLRNQLYQVLPAASPVRFPGLPPVKRSWTGNTIHWHGADAASIVAARVADEIMVDPETGEVREEIPPVGVICGAVAEAIVACAGLEAKSKSWRKESLKARGIDPKPLYVSQGGRPSVRWL